MKLIYLLTLIFGYASTVVADDSVEKTSARIYHEDFSKHPLSDLSDSFLVLDGTFKVVEQESNRLVRLPGAPLDQFAFMFGPYLESNISVRCFFKAERKGRRYPSFGVGLHGLSGYQLRLSPAKRKIEILVEEELVFSVPFKWDFKKEWTIVELELIQDPQKSKWHLHGFIWQDEKQKERPKKPIISYTLDEEPFGGESLVFGIPYAGEPIYFDNLSIVEKDVLSRE